jgi:predicted peptidase
MVAVSAASSQLFRSMRFFHRRCRLVSGCISFLGTVVLAFALASGAMTVRAQPALITFDDLPDATGSHIPNGYNGLNWQSFFHMDPVLRYGSDPNGYQAGMVSPKSVAYDSGGSSASITNTVPFNFISAYLTAAWNDNLQVEVMGYVGTSLIYSNTYTLSATAPTLINFNYLGVDKVYFNPFGGTKHPGYGGTGEHFAMDNVTILTTTAAAPTDLSATGGNLQVALSWTASIGAASYNVKRSTASGGPYTTVTNVTSTTFTDTGLANGTMYYYVVTAVNVSGESPNSNQAGATVAARTWQSGLALSYTDGTNTMPYRLYLPLNYSAATNYPLVLFLHGAGESGTDNIAQVKNHIAGLIARTYSDYPAILVAPQVINSWWTPYNPDDLTLGILAQVRRNYAVDDRRIYLTGLSIGGFGTTDYAYDFPTLFAAIAPMSGADDFTPDAITEFQLSQLPTWLFHGSADTVVSVAYSRDYYTNVTGLMNITFTQTNYGYPTAVSGPIRYTELTGKSHDIWELIYAGASTDFYDWMFSQTRPPAIFTFTAASANGGMFVFGGTNNVPFAAGYLLSSTNLLTPRSQWQCIAMNWCDASGSLMFTNNLDPNENQQFYILKLP